MYLIHLFERIYSREVGRVAIFSFQSSLLCREQRMSAPPSTTSTSSAATPRVLLARPWRTLSLGNTELFYTLVLSTPLARLFSHLEPLAMDPKESTGLKTCRNLYNYRIRINISTFKGQSRS